MRLTNIVSRKSLTRLSLLIQAADTYLHISTDAIEAVRIQAEAASAHAYSRGLSPACLTRPTSGSSPNKYFWGCGTQINAAKQISMTNRTEVNALTMGSSRAHSIMEFTDRENIYTAIIGPSNPPRDKDWQATSFGVSSQCRTIRNDTCERLKPSRNATNGGGAILPFKCTRERAGIDISGDIYPVTTLIYFYDWHRFIKDPPPFWFPEVSSNEPEYLETAANLSEEDGEGVFSNPWPSINVIQMFGDTVRSIGPLDKGNELWTMNSQRRSFFFSCNTTGMFSLLPSLPGSILFRKLILF